MNKKQEQYLIEFAICLSFIAFFSIIGGCVRSCSNGGGSTHHRHHYSCITISNSKQSWNLISENA